MWKGSRSSLFMHMLRGGTNPSIGKHDPRMLSNFEFKSTGFCETEYDSRAIDAEQAPGYKGASTERVFDFDDTWSMATATIGK